MTAAPDIKAKTLRRVDVRSFRCSLVDRSNPGAELMPIPFQWTIWTRYDGLPPMMYPRRVKYLVVGRNT